MNNLVEEIHTEKIFAFQLNNHLTIICVGIK